jgi:hypothetical protein
MVKIIQGEDSDLQVHHLGGDQIETSIIEETIGKGIVVITNLGQDHVLEIEEEIGNN